MEHCLLCGEEFLEPPAAHSLLIDFPKGSACQACLMRGFKTVLDEKIGGFWADSLYRRIKYVYRKRAKAKMEKKE